MHLKTAMDQGAGRSGLRFLGFLLFGLVILLLFGYGFVQRLPGLGIKPAAFANAVRFLKYPQSMFGIGPQITIGLQGSIFYAFIAQCNQVFLHLDGFFS